MSGLHLAAHHGLDDLVRGGSLPYPSCGTNGISPFHIAAFHGYEDTFKALAEVYIEGVGDQMNNGDTALHVVVGPTLVRAFRVGQVGEVDPNIQNVEGQTPVMSACRRSLTKCVAELLRFPGIDVSLRDVQGWSALEWTCKAYLTPDPSSILPVGYRSNEGALLLSMLLGAHDWSATAILEAALVAIDITQISSKLTTPLLEKLLVQAATKLEDAGERLTNEVILVIIRASRKACPRYISTVLASLGLITLSAAFKSKNHHQTLGETAKLMGIESSLAAMSSPANQAPPSVFRGLLPNAVGAGKAPIQRSPCRSLVALRLEHAIYRTSLHRCYRCHNNQATPVFLLHLCRLVFSNPSWKQPMSITSAVRTAKGNL